MTSQAAQNTTAVVKISENYGDYSSTHKRVRKIMMDEIRKQVQTYLASRENKHFESSGFNIGDIACADGRNSMDLYEMLQMTDPENAVQLNSSLKALADNWSLRLSDINDHQDDIKRYFKEDPKVTFQKDGDFYHQIYSSKSMDVVVSSIGMHWLPKETDHWSGHVNVMHPGLSKEEVTERMEYGRQVFNDIIDARAKELKPGGVLILANLAEHGSYIPMDINCTGMKHTTGIMELIGRLGVEDFDVEIHVHHYNRTKKELEEPFQRNPEIWSSVHSENITAKCAYYRKYLLDISQGHDAENAVKTYGENLAESVRGWSIARVTRAFRKKGMSGEQLDINIKKFYARLAEEVSKNPKEYEFDFKINLLVAERTKK